MLKLLPAFIQRQMLAHLVNFPMGRSILNQTTVCMLFHLSLGAVNFFLEFSNEGFTFAPFVLYIDILFQINLISFNNFGSCRFI